MYDIIRENKRNEKETRYVELYVTDKCHSSFKVPGLCHVF